LNRQHDAALPLAEVLRSAADAWRLFRGGASLDRALAATFASQLPPAAARSRLAAATKDVAYGAARRLALVEAIVARLSRQAPTPAVAALLAVTLGQLLAGRHADYAVVDQAVRAAKADHATRHAAGFVNALLRNVLREREALIAELGQRDGIRYNAPGWWIDRLRDAYPEHWSSILEVQQVPPPLVLRVNLRRTTVADYLASVRVSGIGATRVGEQAVWLHVARPVDAIPGFRDGDVSVQDAGAQLAASWLGVTDGMRVLDACAAPGGKTGHLTELAQVSVDAVDGDPTRADLIEDNLARLRARELATIDVIVADAAQPARWPGADGGRRGGYDRILLDAPCTASGIVRRHPDIPWLRRSADVVQLATQQRQLMDALWPLVAPTGRLLYVVCSLFPEEGRFLAEDFERRHRDARAVELPCRGTSALQLLPRRESAESWEAGLPTEHDGFFFALFERRKA
jgi:16S rRNA (cytosine967-C5)-methyltransferase